MNQLKPVLIEDFNEIKSPSSLQYSPDEKTLAFTLVQPDKENNKYSKNLWIMEENKEAVQLTSSGKDGDFIWEDDQTILFVSERSEKKDDLEEKTTFYRINIHGGESKQAFSVSRSVSFFKKLSNGLYCMGIEENRNSLPLDADEKLRKEEKDYHVIDEVPVWGNGRGFISGVRTCLYLYDEPVTERGSTLSAGQRQLLSFARTLAYDPKILVLDEATANIDTETETLITQALARLMDGRTTIMVAHRLSTIQHADKIIVMHHGEIKESGTHQELLAKDGLYKKLYELQLMD